MGRLKVGGRKGNLYVRPITTIFTGSIRFQIGLDSWNGIICTTFHQYGSPLCVSLCPGTEPGPGRFSDRRHRNNRRNSNRRAFRGNHCSVGRPLGVSKDDAGGFGISYPRNGHRRDFAILRHGFAGDVFDRTELWYLCTGLSSICRTTDILQPQRIGNRNH